MSGIVNVADTFGEFILDLRLKRPEVLVHMSSLCNGFEGWLKFEFYFWLLTHKNLKPENEDIGLEYKLEIKDSYYKTKQCDLWVRDSQDNNKFHYIELKLVFSNGNTTKMFQQATDDAWYMAKIRTTEPQAPKTGNCIVLSINLTEDSWNRGLANIQNRYNLPDMQQVREQPIDTNGIIRWAVFTQIYS